MIQPQDFSICLYLNPAYIRASMIATQAYGGDVARFKDDTLYLWEAGSLGELYGGNGVVEVTPISRVRAAIADHLAGHPFHPDEEFRETLTRHGQAIDELGWPLETLVMWPW